jgi:Putative inner membrane protein (DUF1819)
MFPLLQRTPLNAPQYTTQLQAGLGLIPETMRLLALWQPPDMSGQELLRDALASGEFPKVSARRLRNIVIEAFVPRYLVDEAAPARLLKALVGRVPAAEFRHLLFLYSCRANPILADFVREIYWSRYAAGAQSVEKDDAVLFVQRAIARGRTATHWAPSTIVRVSNYLMGAAADFGLLGPMKQRARSILPYRISSLTVSVLAHDLHAKGFGDNALIRHPDWTLFGVEPDDVLQELRHLALRGEIIVQSAAATTHIGWKYKTLEELAHGLAEG